MTDRKPYISAKARQERRDRINTVILMVGYALFILSLITASFKMGN